jgi:DNA-binding NarL/FixJ family response regulator
MRCLIVDDNETFLDAARAFLEQEGLEVAGTASTGAEALHLIGTLHPEVVLLDVFLGDESGLELATRLRGTGDKPVVIFVSTHAQGDVDALISGSGAAGFLPKAELSAAAIRAMVDGRFG